MSERLNENLLSPEGFTRNQEILAGMLFDTNVTASVHIKRENEPIDLHIDRKMPIFDFRKPGEQGFILRNTEVSPFYLNLRNLPDDVLNQIGIAFQESYTGRKPDFIAGIPNAGDALAIAYGERADVPAAKIFRKEGRKIVAGKDIEKEEGKTLVIVDDVVTGGDTKFEAIEEAEKMGFNLLGVLAIVDRQQGGVEQIEARRYPVRTVFSISQLLEFGKRTERLGQQQYNEAIDFLKERRKAYS